MQKLLDLGLSAYQARAYLTLLRLGRTEAREVSRLSRVPLAKVYNVLDNLLSRGLVLAEPTSPKRFAPVPLADYFAALRAQRLREARELEDAAREVGELFRVEPEAPSFAEGRVRTLKGRGPNLQHLETLLDAAREDVLLAPSLGFFSRFQRVWPAFEAAAERGVRVRVLVDVARVPEGHRLAMTRCAQVRHREDLAQAAEPVCLLLVDGTRAHAIHHVPDDGGLLRGADVGLYLDEGALVQSLRRHVEAHWNASAAQADAAAPPEVGVTMRCARSP